MEQTTHSDSALVAELNDLRQLDHDAVQAYTVAIDRIRSGTHGETLRQFRGDHERHIEELTALIRARGGIPIELPHLPSGVFKLAVQAVGAAAGDRNLLLAFKANERQVRDKYRRVAEGIHPVEVASVVHRAAEDEARHYAWCLEALDEMGFQWDSTAGRAERAFEVAHKGVADATEAAERKAMQGAEVVRRAAKRVTRTKLGKVGTAVVVASAGALLWQLVGRDRR